MHCRGGTRSQGVPGIGLQPKCIDVWRSHGEYKLGGISLQFGVSEYSCLNNLREVCL